MNRLDISFDWNGLSPNKSSLVGLAYIPSMPVYLEKEGTEELIESEMNVITIGLLLFTVSIMFL